VKPDLNWQRCKFFRLRCARRWLCYIFKVLCWHSPGGSRKHHWRFTCATGVPLLCRLAGSPKWL